MRARLGFGVLVGAMVLATPAFGYVRTLTNQGMAAYWPNPCVSIVVHVGNPPPGATSDFITAAAEAASGVWTRPSTTCTDLQIRVVSSQSAPPRAVDDRRNNLILSNTGWERKQTDPTIVGYADNALALTTVWAHPDTGVVEDADIEINAVNFVWVDLVAQPNPGGNAADLQNSLAHEFGHFFGLDHNCTLDSDPPGTVRHDQNGNVAPNCKDATPEQRAVTMFAAVSQGDVDRRTLDPDDVAGVCAIYPSSGAPLCNFDGGSGGCTVASDSTPAEGISGVGLCVFGLAFGVWGFRARRSRG